MIKDTQEGITAITWNVYGKIKTISKSGITITYGYDASGNVMSVYTKDEAINDGDLTQTELHKYGSSRLGLLNLTENVENPVANTTGIYTFIRGKTLYELSNHLGNVLATVSDKKFGHDAGAGTVIDYWLADVVTANDYYPFGMGMVGRKFAQSGRDYRYSINGQEKDKELNENITTALFWEFDSRIGRRWNIDPKLAAFNSPYLTFENNPILNSDVLGDSPPPSLEHKYWYINKIKEFKYNGSISNDPIENIPNAIGNGVIKLANLIPELWNSGVKNVQTLREGTWTEQTSGEIKTVFNNTSDAVAYPFLTPLPQQAQDFSKTINDPNTLSLGVSVWLGAEFSLGGKSPNTSTVYHSTSSVASAENILKGIDPKYFNPDSRFGKGFYTSTTAQGTATELGSYGFKAAATIGFNVERPILLNATGNLLNLVTHMAPKMMGGMAKSLGFDGLIYNSVVPGTTGINIVFFKNFQKLTNGTKK